MTLVIKITHYNLVFTYPITLQMSDFPYIKTECMLSVQTECRFFLCNLCSSAVQGRDSGAQPLSSTATVVCSVLDDNDNPPEFMQPRFHISLPENLPPGVIHTAQASDPDHGTNGTMRYSLVGQC